jgi:NDP-sugar pyrophosphorylase family protein
MLTVILSAGRSTRYSQEGFTCQKSMLPMPDGKVLLEWQLRQLIYDELLYVSREEYKKEELAKLKRIRFNTPVKTVWIQKPTEGPLDGLWAVRKYLRTDSELLIAYNDEIISKNALLSMLDKARAYKYGSAIICFHTDNPRFTPVPKTKLFAGCTYYFRSGKDFLRKCKGKPRGAENGVPDIVYAYRHWLSWEIEKRDFIELGTAREYKIFMAEQGCAV